MLHGVSASGAKLRLRGQEQILLFRDYKVEQQVCVIKDQTLGSDSSIELKYWGLRTEPWM